MPELPEVETTLRGISPFIQPGDHIVKIDVRQPSLRWPIPEDLQRARDIKVKGLLRRGKYILIETQQGTLIIHLGMSGSMRITSRDTIAGKHDHYDIVLADGNIIRYCDPRRFGCLLLTEKWQQHELLCSLGPEPLSKQFDSSYLYAVSRKRQITIKQLIMNSHIVVGVGNIYANEALFLTGVRPTVRAGRLSKIKIEQLTQNIKAVLDAAIQQGGTTLKDFTKSDGKPGYFKQSLQVYGRQGEPCHTCGTAIKQIKQNQRASFYCPQCQK